MRRRARQVTVAASALLLLAILAGAALRPYPLARELWLIRASGYGALGALFLALSMTPLGRLAARAVPGRTMANTVPAIWPALRRAFGIAAAWWALAHAAVGLATYLRGSWAAVLDWPHLRAGALALAILAVLLATSFPRLVRLLRVRLWKQLHRLAYVAAIFVFQHLMLSPFAPRRLVLALFATLAAVALLRFLPPPRTQPAP